LPREITVPSAGWTMTNEVIQGNEWAAYGALDTCNQDETRDSLTGASVRRVAHDGIPGAARRN
jgi:hypothetical protein